MKIVILVLIVSYACAYLFRYILKVIKRDLNESYLKGYKLGHAKGIKI